MVHATGQLDPTVVSPNAAVAALATTRRVGSACPRMAQAELTATTAANDGHQRMTGGYQDCQVSAP